MGSSRVANDKNQFVQRVASHCSLMLVLCISLTRLKIEIDTLQQILHYTSYIRLLLDIVPKLAHLETSISQNILLKEGLQMSQYLKILSTMIGSSPRPASITSSAPMVWEWLARGETLRTEELASLAFETMSLADMAFWMVQDKYEFVLETLRLARLRYLIDANDSEALDDELAGMDELFDDEYRTNIFALNGSAVKRELGDTKAATNLSEDKDDEVEDSKEHVDTYSSSHSKSPSHPDGNDDDETNQRDAGDTEEQGPWENGGDSVGESGSDEGDDASEDRQSEGQSESEDNEEISEKDSESDEDLVEESSGSGWGGDDD